MFFQTFFFETKCFQFMALFVSPSMKCKLANRTTFPYFIITMHKHAALITAHGKFLKETNTFIHANWRGPPPEGVCSRSGPASNDAGGLPHLTLTQGMHLGYGGNPYGPAGTGKTESVKALGNAMGRQVLVFNCDEGIAQRWAPAGMGWVVRQQSFSETVPQPRWLCGAVWEAE